MPGVNETNSTETNKPNATEKYVSTVDKFTIRFGDIQVSAGVGEKGTFVVYGFTDGEGFHSLGKFPQGRYASQWRMTAKMIPAILAFIAADEAKPEEQRRLAYKTAATAKGSKLVDLGESNPIRDAIKLNHPDWTEEQIASAIEAVEAGL